MPWNIVPSNIRLDMDPEFYEYLLDEVTRKTKTERFELTYQWNIQPKGHGVFPYVVEYLAEIRVKHGEVIRHEQTRWWNVLTDNPDTREGISEFFYDIDEYVNPE